MEMGGWELAAWLPAWDWLQASEILQNNPPVPLPCIHHFSALSLSLSSPAENITELECLLTPKQTIFFSNYCMEQTVWSGCCGDWRLETIPTVAVYLRMDHFIHPLLLTHFPKQAPGREQAEVGVPLTWASMTRGPWLGKPLWACSPVSLPYPLLRGTHIHIHTFEDPLLTCMERITNQFVVCLLKNVFFLKMEWLYFNEAHLHTEGLIYESTTRSEKCALFLNKAPTVYQTLTSFCKHFHVIQSLTSFVSTRVELLGKITLLPLKNHFLFKQFPRYSTPPNSSWSWLTLLGQVQWPEHRRTSVPEQVGAGQMSSVQILTKITIA